MTISRRGILASALAALVAAFTPGSAEAKAYEAKIAKLLAQYDNIVQFQTTTFPEFTNVSTVKLSVFKQIRTDRVEEGKKISFLMMKLIHFLNENFIAPNTTSRVQDHDEIVETTKLFLDAAFCARWSEIPPVMLERVIPIAVIRMLLRDYRVMLDPSVTIQVNNKEVKPFETFADRYAGLILSA